MYNYKNIWLISYPILISLLAQNIINITDTAFLGHYDEVSLGASAIGGLFYICVFTIAFGFSTGSQILISRKNGEKNYNEIGLIVFQGIVFLLIISTLLFIATKLFASDILKMMLSSEKVYESTSAFIDLRVYGFFFSAVNVMFRAFYIGITKTKILIVNAFVMAIVNIALDYTLIFGHFGFKEMGIRGAAIASVVAEVTSVLFFITYTHINVDKVKYGLNKIKSFSLILLKRVLSISSFTMMQYFLSMVTWLVFFIAVERLGETELAVSNIIRSLYVILLIPVHSLGLTANSLVSNIIGAGRTNEVIPLIKRIAKVSFLIIVISAVIMLLFRSEILLLYTNNEVHIKKSMMSVVAICIAVIIASIGNIYFCAISGTGNTKAALIIETITIIAYSAYVFIVGILLKASIEICFCIEILYYAMLLILSYFYFKKGKWQNKTI